MAKDVGKDFENDVEKELKILQGHGSLRYVRLYDTKSAGRFIPEQPGDYIVACSQGGALVECKASEKHSSLIGCLSNNVKGHQAAAHRLWVATGNPAWFLFNDVNGFHFEIWHGKTVGEHFASGTPLKKDDCLIRLPYTELGTYLSAIFTGRIK